MNFLVDTHTHTTASGHAYSSVDEIARVASDRGLKIVAITDHSHGMPGGAHDYHFMNLRIIPREIHGVRILKGAEINIVDYEGNVDLSKEVMEELDLVVASLHPPCINFADKETITSCIEKVMENPLIHIIGHPGDDRYPLNPERIVKKAKETGTLLEVNNASLKPESFRPGVRENLKAILEECKKYQVKIVVGSDAHVCYDVGKLDEARELLTELNFPEDLVVNTNTDAIFEFISKNTL